MNNIIRKLTSRKLWLAIAGVAGGICMALGVDASEIETVTGAVLALVSAVTYIITEGKIDAANVAGTIVAIQDAVEELSEDED